MPEACMGWWPGLRVLLPVSLAPQCTWLPSPGTPVHVPSLPTFLLVLQGGLRGLSGTIPAVHEEGFARPAGNGQEPSGETVSADVRTLPGLRCG